MNNIYYHRWHTVTSSEYPTASRSKALIRTMLINSLKTTRKYWPVVIIYEVGLIIVGSTMKHTTEWLTAEIEEMPNGDHIKITEEIREFVKEGGTLDKIGDITQ